MPQIQDSIDFIWASRGDIIFGDTGDVADTKFDPLRSLAQETLTRVKSGVEDWDVFPGLGADIADMVGQPNNKETAELIRTRIIASLARDGFINTRDMEVKYFPLNHESLFIRISIKVSPTALNGNSNSLVLNTLYNYSDNNIYSV